jgi:hypothetical protein
MATLPQTQTQESEDESLARFHRAVRDNEMKIDLWALPLETLGVYVTTFTRTAGLLRILNTGLRTLPKTFTFRHFLHE